MLQGLEPEPLVNKREPAHLALENVKTMSKILESLVAGISVAKHGVCPPKQVRKWLTKEESRVIETDLYSKDDLKDLTSVVKIIQSILNRLIGIAECEPKLREQMIPIYTKDYEFYQDTLNKMFLKGNHGIYHIMDDKFIGDEMTKSCVQAIANLETERTHGSCVIS